MSDIRFNNWYHQSGTGGVYQDGSGNVGIGSSVPTSNLDVAGTVTATTFVGNVTGNQTGTASNATGITTSQITVGDTFLKINQVGLGQTTDTGRNAGVSTAVGTLIYNTTTSSIEAYGPNGWILVKGLNILNVEMMLIGGGGGGAGDQGGGGGAGALYYTSSVEIGNTLPIPIFYLFKI